MKKIIFIALTFLIALFNANAQNIPFKPYKLGSNYNDVKKSESINTLVKEFENEVFVTTGSLNSISNSSDVIVFNEFINEKLSCTTYYVITNVSEIYKEMKYELFKLYGIPQSDEIYSEDNKITASLTQWNFKEYMVWLTMEVNKKQELVLRLKTYTNEHLLNN